MLDSKFVPATDRPLDGSAGKHQKNFPLPILSHETKSLLHNSWTMSFTDREIMPFRLGHSFSRSFNVHLSFGVFRQIRKIGDQSRAEISNVTSLTWKQNLHKLNTKLRHCVPDEKIQWKAGT
jgi:hypothetical protein